MSLLSPQIKAFKAVANCHTVHAAAKQLSLTQTAVTQRLRSLEAQLKTTLFIRSRRGMHLTCEGEALLRYCNATAELEGQALAVIQGASQQTDIQLTITGPTSMMQARVLPQCFDVMRKYPRLFIQFAITDKQSHEQSHVQQLRTGNAQLAVIPPLHTAAEMCSKTLQPEQYVLLCTAEWRQRSLEDIIQHQHIIDFDPSDQMTFQYLQHYDLLAHARHQRYYASRTDALVMLLCQGFGYGVLTKEFAQAYVDEGKLIMLNQGQIYENPLVLAWYDRPEMPGYFSALIEAIQ